MNRAMSSPVISPSGGSNGTTTTLFTVAPTRFKDPVARLWELRFQKVEALPDTPVRVAEASQDHIDSPVLKRSGVAVNSDSGFPILRRCGRWKASQTALERVRAIPILKPH